MWSFFPSISHLLENPKIKSYEKELSFPLVSCLIKEEVQKVKQEWTQDKERFSNLSCEEFQDKLLSRILKILEKEGQKKLRRVVNATGVFLHTNLGRAPLSETVWERAKEQNTHYTNLELSLENKERGGRGGLLSHLLCASLGISKEDYEVLVVNNNAAALFLSLCTFPKESEVIVSRGELVQIGGGFRIPDIIKEAGVKLVEVGTTNHTNLKDYAEALSFGKSQVILKVHRSNFSQEGFVNEVDLESLAQICSPYCPLFYDEGAGNVWVNRFGELSIKKALDKGAHLVMFSGDKLLGGPQAGILLGKKDLISKIKTHPLFRAFRVGKTILSLLQEHLLEILGADPHHFPSLKPLKELKAKGSELEKAFPTLCKVLSTWCTFGGGTTPKYSRESVGLCVQGISGKKAEEFFRTYRSPIIGLLEHDEFLLDLSTLREGDEEIIREALNDLEKTLLLGNSPCL